MTVVQNNLVGYGESDYGSLPYGAGIIGGVLPLQFQAQIVDSQNNLGVQFQSQINDAKNTGTQFFLSPLRFICPGYGEADYGGLPYGANACLASMGVQFEALIKEFEDNLGIEFGSLVDGKNNFGVQFEAQIVDTLNNLGIQFEVFNTQPEVVGMQVEFKILDYTSTMGLQVTAQIADVQQNLGLEFESVTVAPLGLQFRVNLYNTNRLRVLCDFQSRGASSGSGTNAWGNTIATGNNWVTNSQAAGDFDITNVNTDIVEQVYRTTVLTGVRLDCDAEQTVFMDTFAIINHNLTTSAVLRLIGSNTSDFSVVSYSQVISVRLEKIIHIEANLPTEGYRYWRIEIDDPTNTNSYLEIGTILFGGSQVFHGECITDRIIKRPRHFFDTVKTEGFTSVKNDRSLKDSVVLEFRKLDYNKGNWQALEEIIRKERTAQKCLWIPTPSITDPNFTNRFAVFAKIAKMPSQSHRIMGEDEGDYIDLTLELDESE